TTTLGSCRETHADAAASPRPLEVPVTARHLAIAVRAPTLGGQSVAQDLVPVAHDQRLIASRAKGGSAVGTVNVAGVDIAQPFGERNLARTLERRRRGMRDVGELVIRVKRREM